MIIFTHPDCLSHDPGPEHPERRERLEVVLEVLRRDHPDADWREAPIAKLGDLHRVHSPELIEAVMQADFTGYRMLDPETVMCPASRAAVLRAAGAAIAAVDAVMNGNDPVAFCAVRPPGHHATHTVSMGFCLLNNIAVAAAHALDAHGLERVAIVDFDVHHGNGTQAIFSADPRVAYFSTHESGLYPYSGAPSERGAGNIHNLLLPAGSDGLYFRNAWEDLLQELEAFRPQLLLISAGFDADVREPMANLMVGSEDFGWLTAKLRELACHHTGNRVISVLEGGYDLDALRDGVAAHTAELR